MLHTRLKRVLDVLPPGGLYVAQQDVLVGGQRDGDAVALDDGAQRPLGLALDAAVLWSVCVCVCMRVCVRVCVHVCVCVCAR
jgi:hypothetical protein